MLASPPIEESEPFTAAGISWLLDLIDGAESPRIVICGGPRRGKSVAARLFRDAGIPTFCGDPEAKVKNAEPGVTYLPSEIGWSEGSQLIADKWLTAPGPWCCEGVAMPRALRKLIVAGQADLLDGVPVLMIANAAPGTEPTAGQERMAAGVLTVWAQIAPYIPQPIPCCWAGDDLVRTGRL